MIHLNRFFDFFNFAYTPNNKFKLLQNLVAWYSIIVLVLEFNEEWSSYAFDGGYGRPRVMGIAAVVYT